MSEEEFFDGAPVVSWSFAKSEENGVPFAILTLEYLVQNSRGKTETRRSRPYILQTGLLRELGFGSLKAAEVLAGPSEADEPSSH